MVWRIEKTFMESAGMVVRARVDYALFDDGDCGVADLSSGRLAPTTTAGYFISDSTRAQRHLESVVFWPAPTGVGSRRYCPALDCDCRNSDFFLESQPMGRWIVNSLSCVGDFCQRAELFHLAAQFLIFS